MMPAKHFSCPLCALPLRHKDNRYICLNRHSFDQAKEGYVNLLPVQFKHSQNPGDNKAMVNARRAFLEQGYYQPLIEKITALYQQCTKNTDAKHLVLDAGCGEGYYTHQHKTAENSVYGVDIAKEAIKKAAKKYQDCHFSVATLAKLPFEDNTFSWIYSIYAPILESEFTRVLAEGGFLLTVTPAKKHLIELKNYIYDNAKDHDEDKVMIKGLQLYLQENLSYQMKLSTSDDILNLLSMTPFAFKATTQVKETLAHQKDFICQADFLIRVYCL